MRLTLRTMLAHLDGMLTGDDAAEVGKKIEESKFATDLVARIRQLLHKPRLGAPRLEGKGMGLDPNSVADYLENLLPADRVPDFEKVCLESDVHLAEVAACHKILAMVLAKPAEFTPAIRERMYRVGARVADAHARQKAAATDSKGKPKAAPAAKQAAVPNAIPVPAHDGHAAADKRSSKDQPARRNERPRNEVPARVEQPPREKAEKQEVPDYLREARRTRLWPILATVLFAFVLAAVLLRAIGPFDRSHPLARLVLGDSSEVAKNDHLEPNGNKTPEPAPVVPKPAPEKTPQEPDESKTPVEPPAKPSADPADETPAKPPLVTDPPDSVPAKPATTDANPPGEVKPVEPKPVEPKPVDPKPAEPAPAKPAVVIGRYISDQQQVLARLDGKTGEWMRLEKDSPLSSGDRLLVLPTYRPQVTLVSGVQFTVVGESLVELLPADEDGVAHLKVEYGKLVIATSGKPGAQIGFDFGNRQGYASFDNVDSVLAVEVRRYRYPGDFPDKVAATVVSELFPAGGSINWIESKGDATKLGSGQVLTYENAKPALLAELTEMPDWVSGKGQNPIERGASQTLAEKLPTDRSLLLSLQERAELSKETRVEVRSLAIRSLMCLNVFEPFVAALGDEKYRSYWTAQYDTAQNALARGEVAAEELRKAFEAQRPEDAASLYRVLIGYSPEELARSGGAKLIEYLEHESLDFRVLASEDLLRITGKTLSYRPEVVLPRRTQHVQRWKQEQKGGLLVYKSDPSPLVERKAIAKAPAKEPGKEDPSPDPSP